MDVFETKIEGMFLGRPCLLQRELMAQHTFPLLNCAGTLWKLLKTRNGMVLNSKTAVLASDAITYKMMALFKLRKSLFKDDVPNVEQIYNEVVN